MDSADRARPVAITQMAPGEAHALVDADVLPELAPFAQAAAPQSPRHRAVRKLYEILRDIDPRANAEGREQVTLRLGEWVRSRSDAPVGDSGLASTRAQHKRLALLCSSLELFPYFRARLSRLVQTLLLERSALSLFARVGIPGDRGLFAETVDRLSRGLMPQPVDEEDLTELLTRMFPKPGDGAWLTDLNPALAAWFVRLVKTPIAIEGMSNPSLTDVALGAPPSLPDPRLSQPLSRNFTVWAPLKAALLDGVLLLASRVSASGLTDSIRARSKKEALRDSPFFKLPRSIDAFLATSRHDLETAGGWAKECRELVAECDRACIAVHAHMEGQGVSVDMVYRLELIDRSLRRIEVLIDLVAPQAPEAAARNGARLLASLLAEKRRDRSLTDIGRTTTRLLARKIIERAGVTGEHYITVSRKDYVLMLLSAGGGGILTAGTAAAKFFVVDLHRPPLQEGLLNSVNYAGSFILMQFLGFTLATKQPSMTAAALAGAIKSGSEHDGIVNTIARVTRSQIAAALGNVGLVIPACIGLDRFWRSSFGHSFLDADHAKHVIESLHPTLSGTIPYAALTGVLLWLSSLAAGWLENWAVYRRLPQAIAENRIGRVIGYRTTRWASRVFSRNIAGIGGNSVLGMMLAMTPILGKFTGAPLDVRHVTLSTGSLTLAVCSLGDGSASSPEVHAAMVGIGIIGTLNFGVSFALALIVAARAREVSFWQLVKLAWSLLIGFLRSPFRFFLPTESASAATKAH